MTTETMIEEKTFEVTDKVARDSLRVLMETFNILLYGYNKFEKSNRGSIDFLTSFSYENEYNGLSIREYLENKFSLLTSDILDNMKKGYIDMSDLELNLDRITNPNNPDFDFDEYLEFISDIDYRVIDMIIVDESTTLSDILSEMMFDMAILVISSSKKYSDMIDRDDIKEKLNIYNKNKIKITKNEDGIVDMSNMVSDLIDMDPMITFNTEPIPPCTNKTINKFINWVNHIPINSMDQKINFEKNLLDLINKEIKIWKAKNKITSEDKFIVSSYTTPYTFETMVEIDGKFIVAGMVDGASYLEERVMVA